MADSAKEKARGGRYWNLSFHALCFICFAAAVTETITPVLDCTAIADATQPVPTKLVLLGAVPWSFEIDDCLT